MSAEDFVIKYLQLLDENNYNPDTLKLLAAIVDTSKDGLISYPEFQAFEGLLCFPDALYKTAFQMFDTNGNGVVSFREYSFCFSGFYYIIISLDVLGQGQLQMFHSKFWSHNN